MEWPWSYIHMLHPGRGNVYDETLRGVWPLTVSHGAGIDDLSSGKHRNPQLLIMYWVGIEVSQSIHCTRKIMEIRTSKLSRVCAHAGIEYADWFALQPIIETIYSTVHQGFVSPWTLQGYGGYFSLFTIPLLAVCSLPFTNLQVICQWHSTTFNTVG